MSEEFNASISGVMSPPPPQGTLREGVKESLERAPHGKRDGWALAKERVLVAVGASLNFRTLRDMYGDVVLDPSRLTFHSMIAEGNFGTVSKYQYLESDGSEDYLAIKRLRAGDLSAQCAPGSFGFYEGGENIEEDVHGDQLKHYNIAAFRGTGYLASENEGEEDDVFLAQELMEGGTLRSTLENQRRLKDQKLYSMSTGLQWLIDVASALAYLHGSEPLVIHRDLKPENIMLNGANVAKIVDFGLHKVVDKWEREDARDEDGFYDMTGGTGAYIYMPPEAFLGQRYNHKVDVYSYAMVTWEIVHYQMLIAKYCVTGTSAEVKNYAKYVATENYRPPIAGTLPTDLVRLIQDMWEQDPNERPEFEEIVPRMKAIRAVVKQKEDQARKREEETNLCERIEQKSCFWCCF